MSASRRTAVTAGAFLAGTASSALLASLYSEDSLICVRTTTKAEPDLQTSQQQQHPETPSMPVYKTIRQMENAASSALNQTKIRLQVVTRFIDIMSRSAFVVVDYKLHSKLLDLGMLSTYEQENATLPPMAEADNIAPSRFPPELTPVHARAAQSMYRACAKHGGLLVKLGQYISTNMGGFAPPEYIEALRPLQDSCSPLDIEVVLDLIRKELWMLRHDDTVTYDNVEAAELLDSTFVSIDKIPLGSASLAQVHRATLKGNQVVAIKVQRPNLEMTTHADLLALEILSSAVEYFFPGAGFQWMIPEFHSTIAAELDFTQEATNAERCKNMLRGSSLTTNPGLFHVLLPRSTPKNVPTSGFSTAIVPTPLRELTTTKMLTMTYEEGFKITNLEKLRQEGIDSAKVAAATCALFAELTHVHGFVHADPHPGNILVRPRSKRGEFDLVLLDHGMYRRLDENFRASYSKLWAGLVSGNDRLAAEGVRGMRLPEKYLDFFGLMLVYRIPSGLLDAKSVFGRQKLGNVMGKQSRESLRQHFQEKFGDDVFSSSAMNDFMQSQPRDLLFCLRCMNLVRGVNRQLGGSTLDRFIAFGTAASRGAKISMSTRSSAAPILTQSRADHLTSSTLDKKPIDDALSVAKKLLNVPVASEINVQSNKESNVLVPRTMMDVLDALRISLRVWSQSFFIDFLLMLGGRKPDISPMRLG